MSENLKYAPSTNLAVGIEHAITAGGNFDGTLPVFSAQSPITMGHGMNRFPAGATGGLFFFENNENILVQQYTFDFGSVVDWTLSIVNLDDTGAVVSGEACRLDSGHGAYAARVENMHVLIGANQALKLTTEGGTQAMRAWVWACTQRGSQGG